ncbi:MAG: hypothetical protein ACREI9_02640 [Nitrospiraceae bacterium]
MGIFAGIAISLALFAVTEARTADWSAYKQTSVAQAWSETHIVEGTDYTIEAANIKYTVEADYTSKHRELVSVRKELLRRWARSLSHPPEYAAMFEHEIQISAGKQEFWLPIQNSLVEPFAAEATKGSHLRLRIMYIGATGRERVFVINGFEVLPK